MKLNRFLAVLAVSGLIAAACSGAASTTAPAVAPSTAAPSAAAPSTAAPSTATNATASSSAAGKTVCFTELLSAHAYDTPMNKGVLDKLNAAGVKVNVTSAENDLATQVQQFNDCITRKVDGIIIQPADPKAFIASVKKAHDAGIPVLVVNAPMDASADAYLAAVTGPDNKFVGVQNAQGLAAAMGATGNIIVLNGFAGYGPEIETADAFTSTLASVAPNIKILASINADYDQQKALVASRDLITKYGDQIKGVMAENDEMAAGFVQAWKEAGKTTQIPVVCHNGNQWAFAAIKDGTIVQTIIQSPIVDGQLAGSTMVDILSGKTVPFNQYISMPVITKANVDQYQPAY